MEKDKKDGGGFITLVNSPGGFFTTPSIGVPATKTRDLDDIADDLLKDVRIPLVKSEK